MKSNYGDPFIINRVTFKFTRLIDSKENYYKTFSVWDAKTMAESQGLDLVCFAMPKGDELALCKIINFGKWRFANEKAAKKVTKEQKHTTKEIWFTPHIAENDIDHKVQHAKDFIEQGSDVILYLKVTGRDLSHMDLAHDKMNMICEKCQSFSKVGSRKTSEGHIIVRLNKV